MAAKNPANGSAIASSRSSQLFATTLSHQPRRSRRPTNGPPSVPKNWIIVTGAKIPVPNTASHCKARIAMPTIVAPGPMRRPAVELVSFILIAPYDSWLTLRSPTSYLSRNQIEHSEGPTPLEQRRDSGGGRIRTDRYHPIPITDEPEALEEAHSYRNAVTGSTRVARRAGTRTAANATASNVAEIRTKVVGSHALTP